MIRADSVADFKRIDGLIDFAQHYPNRVATVVQTTFNEKSPELLTLLQASPQRRAVHPFVWSLNPVRNERGRRGFWARVRSGEIKTDGYGYLRTGGLAAAYAVDVTVVDNEVLTFIRNKANRSYRYTKGAWQIPGHVATGWQKDKPVIDAWMVSYTAYLVSQMRLVKFATTG